MTLATRRTTLRLGAAALLAPAAPSQPSHKFRAIAFDAFAVFDPRPVFTLTSLLVPQRSEELIALWRTRQFEYMWLRSLTGRYADFTRATEDALIFAAHSLGVSLTVESRRRIMDQYGQLRAWSEVPAAVSLLKQAGLRLALLSNMSEVMLQSCIRHSGLQGVFEQILSADRVKIYKPAPRAYEMGPTSLQLPKTEILFAAYAGWDAHGARAFGYPTFWVNRARQSEEELGHPPDSVGASLDDLVAFVEEEKG